MSISWKVKTVLTVLLALFMATAILPAVGHPVIQRSASAASDPIAVGNSYEDQYDAIVVQYANANGLNPFLLKAQIMLESGFDTNAQSSQVNVACDWTHDEGLMQINPYCSGTGNANLYDAWTNIQIGSSIMGALYRQFGSYDLALQVYNIGASLVANGQRNWAYSNAVDSYAQQFESENAALSNSGNTSPASGTSKSTTYTVQSGDTLWSIGQRYGVSWQLIASENGISSPYLINPGETLTIPGASTAYTVQAGNYLSEIGLQYGVSWQSIAAANGISAPYIIYPGETLMIP
jgi:LysM repeat protein